MAYEPQNAYVHINRRVYNQRQLDKEFGLIVEEERSVKQKCSNTCSAARFSRKLYNFFTIIEIIRTYKIREYFLSDLMSGLSVGIMFIPQGMGFALLTGVPAYYGLYAAFWPVLFYVFFGTSRHSNIGAMALISLFIGAVVEREIETHQNTSNTTDSGALTEDDINLKRASIACGVSLLIGIIQMCMGVLRLGIVMRFMSTSFISGFTTGAGVHIVTSQFRNIFGLKLKRYDGIFKIPLIWYELCKNIEDSNVAEIIIAILCIVVLFVLKEIINERYKKKLPAPIPAELLVLISATVLSHYLNFSEKYQVRILGTIPKGMPTPALPPMENSSNYLVDAFIAAIISFAISAAMANIFARQFKYQIDANQEMLAYGISHVCSAFFWSFAGAAAPSRSFVQVTSGGKTQVASLFSCGLILLVIFFLGPYLESLPNSVLGAVIIVALVPLYKQVTDIRRFWKLNKPDCSIWVVTFLATVFLDISVGLGIGMVFSVLTVVLQGCFAKSYTMVTQKDTGLYVPSKRYSNVDRLDNVLVFKYDSSLYFTTASDFKKQLQVAYNECLEMSSLDSMNSLTGTNKSNQTNTFVKSNQVSSQPNGFIDDMEEKVPSKQLKAIIIDCSAINYIDIMGLDAIIQAQEDFDAIGVDFVLTSCNEQMLQKLFRKGLYSTEEPKSLKVFASVHDAYLACSRCTEGQIYVIDSELLDTRL